MTSGIILLDKPTGLTSFDCIRSLKRQLNRSDLGHGGTLDMFASGLLPILVGDGLKLVRFFLESYPTLSTYWKTYTGVFEMGKATDTGDPEGEVTETKPATNLTAEQITAAMQTFVNCVYEQMPPRYSAKKIAGTRASDMVRAGKTPELKAVSVHIRRFECHGIDENFIRFEVECSKGTYIRSLAQDLARKLDTVAHVKSLRRTAVGHFQVTDAVPLEFVGRSTDEAIHDLAFATSFLQPFPLMENEKAQLSVGRTDHIAARLANSGLGADVYCATIQQSEPKPVPAALLELTAEKSVNFLRAFVLNS